MTDPQEPEHVRSRAVVVVGVAVVAITLALVGIAWLFVVRKPPDQLPDHSSVLEHGLFDDASDGADANASGAQRLERYRWVDRSSHVAAIPIERAIDAVVANPALIGGKP